jgi:hypothetical protein
MAEWRTESGLVVTPEDPTETPVGSEARILVYQARYLANLPIFNDQDSQAVAPRRKLSGRSASGDNRTRRGNIIPRTADDKHRFHEWAPWSPGKKPRPPGLTALWDTVVTLQEGEKRIHRRR